MANAIAASGSSIRSWSKTAPPRFADLYFDLKEESVNRGEIDYPALIAGRPQAVRSNPGGKFPAVPYRRCRCLPQHSCRIYDALRLCKDF